MQSLIYQVDLVVYGKAISLHVSSPTVANKMLPLSIIIINFQLSVESW